MERSRTLGLVGVAALTGVGFVLVERHVRAPMLAPDLFTSTRFSGTTVIGLLFNLGLYGTLFCLALVLERTLHESAAATGLTLLPLTAVVGLCALASGRLATRFGPRTLMLIGLIGGLAATALLAGFGDHLGVAGLAGLAGLAAVLGLVGLAMPAMTGVALRRRLATGGSGGRRAQRRPPSRRSHRRRTAAAAPHLRTSGTGDRARARTCSARWLWPRSDT